MILPLFSKVFKIVNDKQATDELNMSIFSSRWNRSVNLLIVALISQNTNFKLAFKFLAEFYLGLSASTIHGSQRKCPFL